jgi:hypothetical protein
VTTFRIWKRSSHATVEISGVDTTEVKAVLEAFSFDSDTLNAQFKTLHDFNLTNASPIIRGTKGGHLLFQQYSLMEALYESPFYWMARDKGYSATALNNRGTFTEKFSRERLTKVFGEQHVFANVVIRRKKGGTILGEIDVLVIFGDRAIILQAKSKKADSRSAKRQ